MSEIVEADDDAEIMNDDAAPVVSGITVDASEGIRPPAEIVAHAEDTPGVNHLIARRYASSGRYRMILVTCISYSTTEAPEGWNIRSVRPMDDGTARVTLTEDRE